MSFVLMVTDDVDDSAQRITAVKQRRRAFDNFDPFGAQRIHGLAVITRLRSYGSAAYSILEHQNTIAIETTYYWTRRSGTEAALCHTGFCFEDLAQRCRRTLCDPRGAHRIDCLERIENGLLRTGCGYGNLLSYRCKR